MKTQRLLITVMSMKIKLGLIISFLCLIYFGIEGCTNIESKIYTSENSIRIYCPIGTRLSIEDKKEIPSIDGHTYKSIWTISCFVN